MTDRIAQPASGTRIGYENNRIVVPDDPIVPYIEGDGTGPDIWRATQVVLDGVVEKVYGGKKKFHWHEVYAGDKAFAKFGEYLPQETLDQLAHYRVSIKGPLSTPVGGGIRSLNVTLRQVLDLFACVRPVRYFAGVPSPMKNPEKLNVVIFRENTEDVYAGIEWAEGTPEVAKVINFLNGTMGKKIRPDSGVGIKPISATASKRLVRKAIQYALVNGKTVVTLVHKGNIMKFTEGAFRDWGYQLAKEEFSGQVVSEDEVQKQSAGKVPAGKVLINDRIADAMFQQL